jgi:glycosyltransferase involved in cell wall biosynthesis
LAVASAVRAACRLRPDALYVYRYWDIPYAVVVGALTRAPVVFHLCLPPPRDVPTWLGASLRRVTRTLSVSEDTAARWHNTGLRPEEVTVVLTGIDLAQYVPAPAGARAGTRRELGVAEDAFVVLYAGRIGREKGVDVLVHAFAEVSATRPGCHLVVVGSPSLGADPADSAAYEDELRMLAADLPVSWIAAQRDVVALIQAADVAVVPSLWPEPLSRSVMEPLACGVPVVATRVGGNPEILTGWLSEYLVEAGDVAALTARISSLHRWRTHDPNLGDRCRTEAEMRLSLDAEIDAIEAALDAASGSAQEPRRRRRTASPRDATSCG